MWHYLYFIVLIKVKDPTEFTGPESYVHEMVKVRKTQPARYIICDSPCSTELCKNITAKFRESTSKCSAAHPKNALWRYISATWQECFYKTLYTVGRPVIR